MKIVKIDKFTLAENIFKFIWYHQFKYFYKYFFNYLPYLVISKKTIPNYKYFDNNN